MSKRKETKKESPTRRRLRPGHRATANGKSLRSYEVGALPMIDRMVRRMRLPEILHECLPPDDPRVELPTYRGLSVLVCNLLVSREPIYGVGQWAARYAPDLLDLWYREVQLLNDDRIGRCLDRLSGAQQGRHVGLSNRNGICRLNLDVMLKSRSISTAGQNNGSGQAQQRNSDPRSWLGVKQDVFLNLYQFAT